MRKSACERIRDAIAEKTGARVEELRMKFVLRDPLSVLETQTNAVIPLTFEPVMVTIPISRRRASLPSSGRHHRAVLGSLKVGLPSADGHSP